MWHTTHTTMHASPSPRQPASGRYVAKQVPVVIVWLQIWQHLCCTRYWSFMPVPQVRFKRQSIGHSKCPLICMTSHITLLLCSDGVVLNCCVPVSTSPLVCLFAQLQGLLTQCLACRGTPNYANMCMPFPRMFPACLQVYELLNLTPDARSYVEHNGSLDILRPAVVHMRKYQQGRGVIAVSPR